MKGTLKNNFLTLDCNLDNYFIIPDGAEGNAENYYTDVCGLAQIGETTYCAKTNTAGETAVYAYDPSGSGVSRITDTALDYFGVDLAAYVQRSENGAALSEDLLLLGKTSAGGNGQSMIIRMSKDGMVQEIYTVDFDAAGISFYKTENGQDLFLVMHAADDPVNLTVEVGTLDETTGSFVYSAADRLNLKNTGYTNDVRGIYYADGPLLVITNKGGNSCENAIMVYTNLYCPKDVYDPTAKFYIKPASTAYTQFDVKGACADQDGILTVAMDCSDAQERPAYRDAVKKIPITFVDNRFEVELGLKRGSLVPNQNQCHNFGTMALDGTTLYGFKTATGDTHQLLFKAEDYTDYTSDASSARNKLTKVKEYFNESDESDALLGHANGMELCNGYMFVCGAKGIDRLAMDGEFTKRYAAPGLVPKGIAWNDSNSLGQFYVLESKRNNYGEYKYYPLHMGRLTGTQYTKAELLGYVRIGKLDVEGGPIREGTQDILHRAGLGLFIVYNMGERNEAGTYTVKKSALLHVDPDTITEWGGQPRVIPDYALTVTSEEMTIEVESGAFDQTAHRLVMCSNCSGGDSVWYTDQDWTFQKE